MNKLHFGEEALEDVAYLHDGSLEGLLSAVFCSYQRHEQPSDIVCQQRYQPRLGQCSLRIETDAQNASRVQRGIIRQAGRRSFLSVMRASTCDDRDTGMIILRFVQHVMSRSRDSQSSAVLDQLAHPAVADLLRLEKRAVNECEKMRQFIRFSETPQGVWVARCNPNASVVPLVMSHFADRLNDQPFVIFDETHHLAGIYNGKTWEVAVDVSMPSKPESSSRDLEIQEAWKRFYDVVSNDARYHPELRRHFMPVRLWRNLTEMQPRNTSRP